MCGRKSLSENGMWGRKTEESEIIRKNCSVRKRVIHKNDQIAGNKSVSFAKKYYIIEKDRHLK